MHILQQKRCKWDKFQGYLVYLVTSNMIAIMS